ncbi:hypothetical protein BDZ94DRAFT_1289358 [Collybia nuda]|uniref:CID domain-containing protein n=1 Tax=Collybia nuda TaxID=64659 RepID=A0A9P5Y6G5_9AGAR|nr:hypothetical protein BDZ94DRAFT_1289358 [Collybia nuda]
MSLYSQNHYGQASYTNAFIHPAPHSGYQYQYQQLSPPPPPPPPVFQLDPISFRREYTNRLAELNVNSRPIIQNLSMLAQDYSRFAEIVAQCLEAHIRRVPPWMKLPAFYLLDAISKNVYDPYARHFAAFVIPLFLETYGQVDENIRSKMEEMLLTWRTGAPNGKELFGVPPQVAIERGVWGDGGTTLNTSANFYSGSGQITKSQVLSELEFTLGQKERALQANPYDTTSQNHVNVLHQLRKLIEAGVSQEELQQILSQLRTLVRSAAPPPPAPIPTAQTQWQHQTPYPTQPQAQPPFQHPNLHSYPHTTASIPMPYHNVYENVKMEGSSTSVVQSSTSTPTSNPPPPTNIANLLSTLLKAGVVSANGTPLGAGATAKEEASQQSNVESIDHEREASRGYRQAILSQQIQLTSSDIIRKRPQIVEFLYDQLTAQCKQCGIRFADTVVGKKDMENHLDMHFRQNRKANQNIGRGHSRSWFVGVEDWVHNTSVDLKGKGRADGFHPVNPKATAAAENAKREAELRALHVVVPSGDEAKPISCPICKETLKSEFLEDDEDWVWKNAVMKEDRVYHATCHAEAVASTNNLAARLRTEMATGSRSGTPEAQSMSVPLSRSTPPRATLRDSMSKSPSRSPSLESKLAGMKRKVDHNDSVISGEADGTPPFKKLALSSLSTVSDMNVPKF